MYTGEYIKCTFRIDKTIYKWRNVHGDKLEINCEILLLKRWIIKLKKDEVKG